MSSQVAPPNQSPASADRAFQDVNAVTLSLALYGEAPSLATRLWNAVPDWVFRLLGAAFFLGYLAYRAPDYFADFWNIGLFFQLPDGTRLRIPWTRVLVDLTVLLIGLSYLFRLPPRARTARFGDIVIAVAGGFWPTLPFILGAWLAWTDPESYRSYSAFIWRDSLAMVPLLGGAALILAGNALDVWGYTVLFRSCSIVPEARELTVRGPYRFVRHPVYLGQMLAQGGIWLVFARAHLILVLFFVAFVSIQLYRAAVEERVLEQAFGDRYRKWKQATYWFTA